MTPQVRHLPRIGRAGLGNELFPLMRAIEASQGPSDVFVRPSWFKLRIGPYIRRERDRREYWRIMRGPRAGDLVVGLLSRTPLRKRMRIQVHSGMGAFFDDFDFAGRWHRDQLIRLAKYEYPIRFTDCYIAFHVRLGDFARPAPGLSAESSNNVSTPLDWYVHAAKLLRAAAPGWRIVVCSDGSDEELRALLGIDGVERNGPVDALGDILILAGASLIVGSRSTFSAWGAFLGEVPLIVAPGGNAYQPHSQVHEMAIGAALPTEIHSTLDGETRN